MILRQGTDGKLWVLDFQNSKGTGASIRLVDLRELPKPKQDIDFRIRPNRPAPIPKHEVAEPKLRMRIVEIESGRIQFVTEKISDIILGLSYRRPGDAYPEVWDSWQGMWRIPKPVAMNDLTRLVKQVRRNRSIE